MPNDLIDPPDDDLPWGYDFEGDEIWIGDEVYELDSEYVPKEPASKAQRWLEKNGNKVNTEEYRNE